MTLGQLPGVAWVGLVLGATYALIGLGWVIIYRATKVLNFATAEFFVLGGFLLYWTNHTLGIEFYPAALMAVAMAAVLSGAMYGLLVRPLAGAAPFSTVLLTLGMAILLDSMITAIWGATPLTIKPPFPVSSAHILGVPVSVGQLATLSLAVVVACGLAAILKRTRFGIHMRSVAEQPLLASQSGIDVVRSGVAAWAIAGGILALGGVLYASQSAVTETSESFALQALAAAFIGGLDSVGGALLGGLLLGVMESVITQWVSGSIGDASVFALLLVFVLFRPAGLVGKVEARRV